MKASSTGSRWLLLMLVVPCGNAFTTHGNNYEVFLTSLKSHGEDKDQQDTRYISRDDYDNILLHRRNFAKQAILVASGLMSADFMGQQNPMAHAIGPTKITLIPTSYSAVICNKPIPGQKAMMGMRGLCVTAYADLKEKPPKELLKVGVYGFVTDGETGDSVLANNPDLSTDSGQFAMIESIKPTDRSIVFEFIAAVPMDRDLSKYDNGIGPLNFDSLRILSYPGGQQFGAISPCEMNEFSSDCEEWEAENGPYVKQEYMVKSKKG